MSRVLQTPIINQILPFDPKDEQIIEFTYEDTQPVRNRAVISESTSGNVIYDKTQETMRLQHIIPANTLSPGTQYLIQIQVFDADNNSSNLSDLTLFHCLTTPTFNFLNIQNGMKYQNPNIQLTLNYYQPEGEILRNFQFYQYSFDKTLMDSSNVFYLDDYKKYTFYRLDNNKTYYFRATGETNHGIILDTGYIEVNVEYLTDYADALFEVENRYSDGYIQIDSNVVIIEWDLKNDNWELKDGALTLWGDNSLTYYGFKVEGDFILLIEAKKLPLGRFLSTNTYKDDGYNGDGFMLSIVKIAGTYYCQLQVKDTPTSYNDGCYFVELPQSNIITDDEVLITTDLDLILSTENESYDFVDFNEYVVFEVKRINGFYGLDVYYKSDRQK